MTQLRQPNSPRPLGNQLRRLIRLVLFLLVLPVALAGCLMTQPVAGRGGKSTASVDPAALRRHVETICADFTPRSYLDAVNLNRCADWVQQAFQEAGGRASSQMYEASGRKFRNVVARFGPEQGPLIVVGAHYDAFSRLPAADDNASGVAGLIELARLLGRENLPVAVEIVAYSTEEPPFFATADMGSAHHARALKTAGAEVRAVIVLEMIGFFSDQPRSQSFPMALLKLFYPDRGNYIGVVGRLGQAQLARTVKRAMRGATELPVRSISAPTFMPGIDLSDHRSYWDAGYPAVMITDTAFYRNHAYHTEMDTPDQLDYERMAKVVAGVYEAIRALGSSPHS